MQIHFSGRIKIWGILRQRFVDTVTSDISFHRSALNQRVHSCGCEWLVTCRYFYSKINKVWALGTGFQNYTI